MTCAASAIKDGGRVVCILLTTRQKSTTKFRKFGAGKRVTASPRLEAALAQLAEHLIGNQAMTGSKPAGRPNPFTFSLSMISVPCEVYSNKDFYNSDNALVRFQNRGGAIHGSIVRTAKAKPSFLLLACGHAISSNILGQVAYLT